MSTNVTAARVHLWFSATIESRCLERAVTRIVPPRIMSMMCGVAFADLWPSGKVRLTYEDGETESAYLSAERLEQGRDNFFRLVSGVQEQRKASV